MSKLLKMEIEFLKQCRTSEDSVDALIRYGWHLITCPKRKTKSRATMKVCNCGFDTEVARLQALVPPRKEKAA